MDETMDSDMLIGNGGVVCGPRMREKKSWAWSMDQAKRGGARRLDGWLVG